MGSSASHSRLVHDQGTAAISAMVARRLAPRDAKVMAMIGNGAQAEFQALAMKAVVGIEEVRLYDIDANATQKTARNLEGTGLRMPTRQGLKGTTSSCSINAKWRNPISRATSPSNWLIASDSALGSARKKPSASVRLPFPIIRSLSRINPAYSKPQASQILSRLQRHETLS